MSVANATIPSIGTASRAVSGATTPQRRRGAAGCKLLEWRVDILFRPPLWLRPGGPGPAAPCAGRGPAGPWERRLASLEREGPVHARRTHVLGVHPADPGRGRPGHGRAGQTLRAGDPARGAAAPARPPAAAGLRLDGH